MRVSIIIAACNEGELLWRTVQSCATTAGHLGCEIIVVDDASTDGCSRDARERVPGIRVVTHRTRLGASPTKDRGARKARGKVLVFLDGHCKPAPWAIERLVNNVEDSRGEALFVPRVAALDAVRWRSRMDRVGYGYYLDLRAFDNGWFADASAMRSRGRFFESPALQGCAFAISRKLYKKLKGFDPDMYEWGSEDLDMGLKAWLMGHSILHDPTATVAHRFQQPRSPAQQERRGYTVSQVNQVVNRLRMARKNFTDGVWHEWMERERSRVTPERWSDVWDAFNAKHSSLERERDYLLRNRVRDEFGFASYFSLKWPARAEGMFAETASEASDSARSITGRARDRL